MAKNSRAPNILTAISGLGLITYLPLSVKELNYHGPENYSAFIGLLWGLPLFAIQLILGIAVMVTGSNLPPTAKLSVGAVAWLFPIGTAVMIFLQFYR